MKVSAFETVMVAMKKTHMRGSKGAYWDVYRTAICCLGLLLNFFLLYLYYYPEQKLLLGDENYYFELASQLAAGRAVAHEVLWPPLYAEFLSWIFYFAPEGIFLVQLFQIGLWLLCGIVISAITELLLASRRAGTLSLALFLLNPELMAFSHYLWPETIHLTLFCSSLLLLLEANDKPIRLALSGVLLALALLSKLLLLPFLPIIALYIACKSSYDARRRIRHLLVWFFFLIMPLTPILYGNAKLHHRWMIADSSVLNLWIGLQDEGHNDYENSIAAREYFYFTHSADTQAERNSIYRDKIKNYVEQLGYYQILRQQLSKQYFRLFGAYSFFLSQFKGGPRERYSFDADQYSWITGWAYSMHALTLGFGAIGLVLYLGELSSRGMLLISFIAYNLGLFLLIHSKARFLLQFLPFFMVFSGTVLEESYRKRKLLILGVLLAALLEYLAFRGVVSVAMG